MARPADGIHRDHADLCLTKIVGWCVQEFRFTRSARRHRIGKAHALHVIDTTEPIRSPATDVLDERITWIGEDDRGVALEIVALVLG
jgi:hypothetical protein